MTYANTTAPRIKAIPMGLSMELNILAICAQFRPWASGDQRLPYSNRPTTIFGIAQAFAGGPALFSILIGAPNQAELANIRPLPRE